MKSFSWWFLCGLGIHAVAASCVDYTPAHWYEDKARLPGLPAPVSTTTFVSRPPTISVCELEQLHRDCVDRINAYRSGALLFSDGTQDPDVLAGLDPLVQVTGNNRCSSEAAMGDLHYNVVNNPGANGCIGAHHNAFVCKWKGKASQNACCARGDGAWGRWDRANYLTANLTRAELYKCLQTMWDEGIKDGKKGHWLTMKSHDFRNVQCGFAWTEDGRVVMNQDFSRGEPQVDPCSCDAKSHGDPDGCGGTCFEPGAWYCRRPGKNKGKFRKRFCTASCDVDDVIWARCCGDKSGASCSKREKLPPKRCSVPKPSVCAAK